MSESTSTATTETTTTTDASAVDTTGEIAKETKQATPPIPKEEEEEVSIGSKQVKLPKSVAKMIKDTMRSFHSVAQERSELQKQLASIEQTAKTKPYELLKKYGVDPDEFAEMTLSEKIKMLQMDPRDKELMEYKQKDAERLKQEKEAEEAKRAEQEELEYSELRQNLDKEIGEALQGSDLKDSYHLSAMAYVMSQSLAMFKAGKIEEPLTATQALDKVNKMLDGNLADLGTKNPRRLMKSLNIGKILNSLPPEEAYQYLQEAWEPLNKVHLSRVTSKAAPSLSNLTSPGQPVSSQSKSKIPSKLSEANLRDIIDNPSKYI